jgi:hypothetical protein
MTCLSFLRDFFIKKFYQYLFSEEFVSKSHKKVVLIKTSIKKWYQHCYLKTFHKLRTLHICINFPLRQTTLWHNSSLKFERYDKNILSKIKNFTKSIGGQRKFSSTDIFATEDTIHQKICQRPLSYLTMRKKVINDISLTSQCRNTKWRSDIGPREVRVKFGS